MEIWSQTKLYWDCFDALKATFYMVALHNFSDVLYLYHSIITDKSSPSYPTIHFDCSLAEFQKCPCAIQRVQNSLLHCNLVWNELDSNWNGCRLFFSSHDSLFWAALRNSSSKTFLPKKSVCTTLDDCLHSTGIEFSHSGMKSLVFDGHTRSRIVCPKWAFVNLCCEQSKQKSTQKEAPKWLVSLFIAHPEESWLAKKSVFTSVQLHKYVYTNRTRSIPGHGHTAELRKAK